ncbi:hypothetical protein DFQ11_101702 [Winogradskyella epiphytica]|uniref:Uncharacterized protein n=1 Tax=Winogradskyella epiphytica TaxID=262005 RepID=A0A2V4XIX7_9FLAO|nr:hypothetical protein DFQ11_101702 [Winogradskyella epiphytica]GGW56973.1 hypothetical protein GCM10008085_05640 [Winogradskyella epiphytica]
MIKSIIVYIISFTILFFLIHFTQDYFLQQADRSVRFSTWDVNLFFAFVSVFICVHFELFSLIKSLDTQLGFIYLPTLFIKGGLFFLAFQSSVFKLETLNTAERLSIVIPMLLFLGLEAFFVIKIISKKTG